jgi:hypothetical protein
VVATLALAFLPTFSRQALSATLAVGGAGRATERGGAARVGIIRLGSVVLQVLVRATQFRLTEVALTSGFSLTCHDFGQAALQEASLGHVQAQFQRPGIRRHRLLMSPRSP